MGDHLNRVQFVHGINAHRDQFVANIEENSRRVLPVFRPRRAILVAGGPSANDHVDDIVAHAKAGHEVWTVNGAHDWLRKHGIRPHTCVLMDATPAVNAFIDRPMAGVRYMLASQTHPSLVSRLEDSPGVEVMLFHAALDEGAHEIMGDVTITAPANTVSLHALQLMCLSGVRKIKAYGLDSSHRPGADHAYDNSHQAHADEMEFIFQGKSYRATGTWAAQADMFARMWPQFFRIGCMIEVIGDGLLPDMYRHIKAQTIANLQARKDLAHEHV